MNTKTENISDTRKRIDVSFDASEIAQEREKILGDFVRNAKIPGFRPGKAPKNMVEKLYSDAIAEQLERSLAGKAVEQINGLKGCDIYAVVDIKKEGGAGGGETLSFTADIYPEIKFPDSLATQVELDPADASEEEISNGVEFHRNQRAKYEPVDREIKKGDFVRLSYSGKVDGKPVSELAPDMAIFGEQKSTWEEAGNPDTPGVQGIVQGLLGMKKGDKKALTHEFPKEFPVKELAGKKADYDVEVFEVREKKLPELDADFFKALEVDSLDALRSKVKKAIEEEKKSNNEILKRQFAVDQLMKKVDFPVPESAVEDERNAVLEETMLRLMSSGASREDIEKHKDQLYEDAGKEALSRAKMRVFLNGVAKANSLKVDNEDMSRVLWQEAMRTRTKPDELVKRLKKDTSLRNKLRSNALFQKAINFLAEKAEVSYKKA